MLITWITVVGVIFAVVIAGIEVGGAEVAKDDGIGKEEAREEERMHVLRWFVKPQLNRGFEHSLVPPSNQ